VACVPDNFMYNNDSLGSDISVSLDRHSAGTDQSANASKDVRVSIKAFSFLELANEQR
jgi:queuine/archaeosine tRNA-ribosyltransferase